MSGSSGCHKVNFPKSNYANMAAQRLGLLILVKPPANPPSIYFIVQTAFAFLTALSAIVAFSRRKLFTAQRQ